MSQHATSQHRGCHFIPISPSLDLLGTKDSIEALVESLRTTNEFKTGNVFIFGLVAHWARQPRPPRGKVGIMQLTNNADADINGSSIFPDGTAIWCRQSVANGDIARLVMAGAAFQFPGVHMTEALYSRRRDLASNCVSSRSKLSDEWKHGPNSPNWALS